MYIGNPMLTKYVKILYSCDANRKHGRHYASSIETLNNVDFILCEDTRETKNF